MNRKRLVISVAVATNGQLVFLVEPQLFVFTLPTNAYNYQDVSIWIDFGLEQSYNTVTKAIWVSIVENASGMEM